MHKLILVLSTVLLAYPLSGQQKIKNVYNKLPVGSIKTSGWIQKQMEEDARYGWANTVQEMSLQGEWMTGQSDDSAQRVKDNFGKNPFYQPYITKDGYPPVGGEYQAHWLDMMIRFAYSANLPGYKEKVTEIVLRIIDHADKGGYLGPMAVKGNPLRGEDVFIMWAYGETLNALLQYYNYTGDPRVLKALKKAADQVTEIPKEEMTGIVGNQDWYTSMCTFLAGFYEVTGNKRYLDYAEFMLYHYIGSDRNWHMVTGGLAGMIDQDQELLGRHTAGIGIFITSMLKVYQANGDPQIIRWINYALNKLSEKSIQPHGAPPGELEMLTERGPYVNTELCDVFWWSWFWTDMFQLTGDSKFLDLAEKAAYNALPGQRSKDAKVMSYFSCPNQLVATENGTFTFQTHYASRLIIECCQSNGPRLLPYLTERMILKSDGDLAFAYYFNGEVTCPIDQNQNITFKVETEYPFDDQIGIKITQAQGDVPVKLKFRVPQWCNSPKLLVNNAETGVTTEGNWMIIEKVWAKDDFIELVLPLNIKVNFWKERSCYIERGPVLYTLPVKGIKKSIDKWGGFEEILDTTATWNYCLVLNKNKPESSLSVKNYPVEESDLSWEKPRVSLVVNAFALDEWEYKEKDFKNPYRASPFLPLLPEQYYEGIKRARFGRFARPECETVELVPYGNTTLRMTYLPWIHEPVMADFNKE